MSPGSISDDRIYANVGRIRNSGFEINLTSHNIARKDFEWNTTLTSRTTPDKILELYNGIQDRVHQQCMEGRL